jgi:hypothetical protein
VSRLYQIKLKQFEDCKKRLEGLEEEYNASSEELGYTDNRAKRKRLEKEQAARMKEMEQLARECDQLEAELATLAATEAVGLPAQSNNGVEMLRSLLTILTPDEAAITRNLEDAYRSVCPVDWWRPMPTTLKGKLTDLEEMQPDETGHSALLKFVAHLVINPQTPQRLSQQLQQWAEQQQQNFSDVLQQVDQSSLRQGQDSMADGDRCPNAYLMVVVDRQNIGSKQDGDYYFVKAWIVPDAQTCHPQKGLGFYPLPIPGALEDAEKSVTLEDLRHRLRIFLAESAKKCSLPHLTVELFLPADLLNHPVDTWILEPDSDFAAPIGVDHRIILRSSERLREAYLARRGGFWQDKWKRLQQCVQENAAPIFVSGDGENPRRLYQQLSRNDIVGLKLAKEPLSFGKNSAFAVLQEAAIPVALWLRQTLPALDCVAEVDQLLNCCIHDIPEVVKQKRGDAWTEELDCHIGHHLALMWEDCDRLPPDLAYYMP